MSEFKNVTVVKKANIFFDGQVTSRSVLFADGSKKTLGVMQPGEYEFSTDVLENLEILSGELKWKLKGESEWKQYGAGQSFSVPGNSSFEIEVAAGEAYHYVCHFG